MIRTELAFIFTIVLTLACGDLNQTPTGPTPGIDGYERDGASSACHDNMLRLRKAENVYYSQYSCEYTKDLEVLYGILGVDSLVCPSCGLEYVIRVNDDSFRIECPMPASPDHGFVQGFYLSWPPDDPETRCRDNMVAISQYTLGFYLIHGYPVESLQELADFMDIPVEWLNCPVNGPYELWTEESQRLVACPTCSGSRSHGYVLNGNPSWPPDPSEFCTICRSYMTNLLTGLAMFHARIGGYPDSLDDPAFLEVMSGADHLFCPACGASYIYELDPDHEGYYLSCPLPDDPNHGEVINGEPSW